MYKFVHLGVLKLSAAIRSRSPPCCSIIIVYFHTESMNFAFPSVFLWDCTTVYSILADPALDSSAIQRRVHGWSWVALVLSHKGHQGHTNENFLLTGSLSVLLWLVTNTIIDVKRMTGSSLVRWPRFIWNLYIGLSFISRVNFAIEAHMEKYRISVIFSTVKCWTISYTCMYPTLSSYVSYTIK